MKIEILGEVDNIKDAWMISRPNEENFDSSVIDLDLPVNEFKVLNISVESTILEREIFTSARNHVIWAQTSRVQNVLDFKTPDYLPKIDVFDSFRKEMIKSSKNNRQDDYRLGLPILSMTKYSMSISYRNLMKIGEYFKHLRLVAADPIIKRVFLESFVEISSHKNKNQTEEYSMMKTMNEYTPSEDFVFEGVKSISGKINFSLRAQLVRHRNLIVRDSLITEILNNKKLHQFRLSDEIFCSVFGTSEDIKSLVSKRSCWISNYKIWSGLIFQDLPNLPCDSGGCPFAADVKLRSDGKDPNPPCPIYMKDNELNATTEQVDKMRKMVVVDDRPGFWNHEINKLEKKA